jgi:hypothetical protein
MVIEGCETGVKLRGPVQFQNTNSGAIDGGPPAVGCSRVDTCFSARMGAKVFLENALTTNGVFFDTSRDGGVMVHYLLDGVPYSNDFLESLGPPDSGIPQAITSLPYGSTISRNPIP